MPARMLLIGLGALLVFCGVVLVAVLMIRAGPLSRERPSQMVPDATLEPRGRSALFDLRKHLPGIGLIVAGLILLIAAAVV